MKYSILFRLLILVAILALSSTLQAQPGFDDDVVDTPVDGGVGLLIAAGVGFGYRKIRDGVAKIKNINKI